MVVFETALVVVQLMMLTAIAAWLTVGVWDNVVYPSNNETYTAEVMQMDRMREAYPDAFARVAHRAITNRNTQKLAFRFVVLAETAATVVLWAGVILILSSLLGYARPQLAMTVAMLGAAMFTAVWAGFLVIGNYFCYWFCHEGGQNTHFQMTLWGLLTTILMVQSP